MGYICKNYGIFSDKPMDIFGKNYGIYWANTIGYIMGYICKNYGIYLRTMGHILNNFGIYSAKTMGYIGLRL